MINTLYIGTVISNADYTQNVNAQYQGKVLVKIPGLSITGIDKMQYKTAGAGGDLLASVISKLEESEVWAYVISPITGESSQGKYNRSKDISSLSDGNVMSTFNECSRYSSPPSEQFKSQTFDGHAAGPAVNMSAGVNPYGNSYVTENYGNSGKGSFSVPGINSKVLVGFIGGARGLPVVLGKLNSSTEFEQIYGSGNAYPDYPNIFENTSVTPPGVITPNSTTVTIATP